RRRRVIGVVGPGPGFDATLPARVGTIDRLVLVDVDISPLRALPLPVCLDAAVGGAGLHLLRAGLALQVGKQGEAGDLLVFIRAPAGALLVVGAARKLDPAVAVGGGLGLAHRRPVE